MLAPAINTPYRILWFTLLFISHLSLAQNTIQGNVYARDVGGLVVIGCLFDSSTSDCNYEKSQFVSVNSDGSYLLTNLEPGQYVIIAWRDSNGNKTLDQGQDDIGYYTTADGQIAFVTPPASNVAVQVVQASTPATHPLTPQNPLTQPPSNPLTTPAPTSPTSNALVGNWYQGSSSGVDYYNPSTGSWAAPSGSGFRYTFNADGSYEYSGLIQSSLYNCTMTVFGYETGTYSLQNDILVLVQKVSKMKSQDTCNSDFNYEKDVPLEVAYRLLRFGQFQPTGEVTLELTYLILNAQGQLELDPEYSDAGASVFYRETQ
jgi:UDP-N-acetylglucosamine transferase subunit ALG13